RRPARGWPGARGAGGPWAHPPSAPGVAGMGDGRRSPVKAGTRRASFRFLPGQEKRGGPLRIRLVRSASQRCELQGEMLPVALDVVLVAGGLRDPLFSLA